MNMEVKSNNSSTELLIQNAISTSTLLQMFRVEYPKFPVKVRGEITRLVPFPNKENPKCYYGDIADLNGAIEFKLNLSSQIKMVGQYIEIIGTVRTKESYNGVGLGVIIEGEMVANYEVPIESSACLVSFEDRGKKSLHKFISEYGLEQLCILSTSTGIADFFTASDLSYDDVMKIECKFNSRDNIIKALHDVRKKNGIAGFLIVRGGGKSIDMRIWDDPNVVEELLEMDLYFYTALGHSDQTLLADKHSDECFSTPTALGQRLSDILNRIKYEQARSELIDNLEETAASFPSEIDRLKRIIKRLAIAVTIMVTSSGIALYLFLK